MSLLLTLNANFEAVRLFPEVVLSLKSNPQKQVKPVPIPETHRVTIALADLRFRLNYNKFVISLAGLASCSTNAPTFSWLQDSFSPHGVPHLQVDFHDGQAADVVNLKKFNPFVRQIEEKVSISPTFFILLRSYLKAQQFYFENFSYL